jgi:transposase
MARLMLNDELWSKLKMIMQQHKIYDKYNLRLTVEAMLYRMRVGCPWRDLPTEFGCWNSIYQKFNRWSSKDKLVTIFKFLAQEPDLEWEFIDGSIVRAHQHSTGAASAENQAIGKSVGGNTRAKSYFDYIYVTITGSLLSAACPRNPEILFLSEIPRFRGQAAESRLQVHQIRHFVHY